MMMMKMNFENLFSLFALAFLTTTTIWMTTCVIDVDGAPYQELEPRKGHVPVYIRYGNTSLSEIHPGLAEAFGEKEASAALPPTVEGEVSGETKPESVKPKESSSPQAEEIEKDAKETKGDHEKKLATTESDIASFDVVKGNSS